MAFWEQKKTSGLAELAIQSWRYLKSHHENSMSTSNRYEKHCWKGFLRYIFLHSINIPCKECREDSFFHCYGHLLLQSNFDNCTKKCLPHSLPKENMIHHEDIQLCQPSTKDHKCAKNIAFLLRLKLLARDSQSVCKLKPCYNST